MTWNLKKKMKGNTDEKELKNRRGGMSANVRECRESLIALLCLLGLTRFARLYVPLEF